MENFVCEACEEKAFSLCTCSSYLCKIHAEEHKCCDSLDKIIINLYRKADNESRKILTLYLEQIKSKLASCLSLPIADARHYNELHRQSMQIDEQLIFVQNSRYIKNDLFLSPIEFYLTRTQSETKKFIEEASILNINKIDAINYKEIEDIINKIYNFNYFQQQSVIYFEVNWISEKNDDLFIFFYQKGIELLWFKSYENAKKSFLLCKSISEKVISYEKVCKEILNLALSITEQLLLKKKTFECISLIKQTANDLQNAFPLNSSLIFYEISRIYVSIENYDDAIECSLDYLKYIPKETEKFYIWIYLGFLYQCKLDFGSAKIYYDKCDTLIDWNLINSLSELCNYYLSVGEFHIAKGEYKKGIKKYKHGIFKVGGKSNLIKSLMWTNLYWRLGEAYNYQNNFKKSIKCYTKAKDLYIPQNFTA